MGVEERHAAGRHAVVTGGGRGIGAAIAGELARAGARITLMGRDMDALESRAHGLEGAHDVSVAAVRCDVAESGSVEEAFAAAAATLGDVHILVNNAGIAEAGGVADTTPELLERTLAVNLTGAFLCMRQALPGMLRSGWGRVVNIASVAGLRGTRGVAAYSVSKHGLVGLTRVAAAETATTGVTVNAVCPGYVETAMSEKAVANVARARNITPEEARAVIARANPGGRLIQPSEVAGVVGWLCSPAAAAVNGQCVVVAGGEAT